MTQNRKTPVNDSSIYPYWIAMMDSPGVNYNAAVRAFNLYWENRDKPTEENGEGQDIFTPNATEKKHPVEYVYEYKRFLDWQQRNKNLVKPDGTLMTGEEIIEQWKKSQSDTLQR